MQKYETLRDSVYNMHSVAAITLKLVLLFSKVVLLCFYYVNYRNTSSFLFQREVSKVSVLLIKLCHGIEGHFSFENQPYFSRDIFF